MLFAEGTFTGFGPNRFDPLTKMPVCDAINGRKASQLREGVRKQAPKIAGVYGMLDPRGRLHYVGKAKDLRSRLMSYFRPPSRDPKAGRIIAQTRSVVWEHAPSEFAALLRELELIRRYCPPHNVVGQPGRRNYTYLCLGRSPAPYFFRNREVPKKSLAAYGPLPGSRRLGDAIRRLNDMFRLRDCSQATPMQFADQPVLFPIIEPAGCLRYEIGTCHGPCVAAITRRDYSRTVRSAKLFLDGLDPHPIDLMRQEMATAAAAHQFEKAAMLRDKIDDLEWLQARLGWLQNARLEYSFIYPVDDVWYLIRGGRVLSAVVAPRNLTTRRAARKAIDAVYPSAGGSSIVPDDLYDHVLLVSGWFRRRPEELMQTLQPNAARCVCDPAAAA